MVDEIAEHLNVPNPAFTYKSDREELYAWLKANTKGALIHHMSDLFYDHDAPIDKLIRLSGKIIKGNNSNTQYF